MIVVAATREAAWNFPLFVHVLGAAILVGGLVATTSILASARGDARYLRLGYRSLLAVALPGWLVMRVGAEWIYTKEGWDDLPDDAQPTWLDLGWMIGDLGGLILLVALVVGGAGVYRLRRTGAGGLLKGTLVLSLVLLVAYVVAVWAMAGKPS